MIAPKCRSCGKREWDHTCGRLPRRFANKPLREPEKPSDVTTAILPLPIKPGPLMKAYEALRSSQKPSKAFIEAKAPNPPLIEVKGVTETPRASVVCSCGCGEVIELKPRYFNSACRKRASRQRG